MNFFLSFQESSLTQKLQARQEAGEAGNKELDAKLQSLVEEKEKLKEAHKNEVVSLQAQQEENVAMIGRLTAEGEGLRARLVEVEDSKEVIVSEMASLQADLATVTSERNTQQMATEAVSGEEARSDRSTQASFLGYLV